VLYLQAELIGHPDDFDPACHLSHANPTRVFAAKAAIHMLWTRDIHLDLRLRFLAHGYTDMRRYDWTA